MPAESTPIQVFLSYAHADDAEFQVVQPLVSKLKAFVRAKTGRSLEVFVDRESIGWGADWRSSISDSVKNATIFIPLLSANYLDSEACREELLAFHSKAEVLGVTELLLPILIFRSALFEAGTADEVAQIAERLQYRCIEEALLAGYSSPDWLTCMRDLAEDLIKVLTQAEESLLEGGLPPPKADDGSNDEVETATSDEDEIGLAEVLGDLESSIDAMTAAAEALTPAMEALGDVVSNVGPLPADANPKQLNAWTLRLASEFKGPSEGLERTGRDLFEATKNLDETLLKLQQLTESLNDIPDVSDPLREGRLSLVSQFGDLREVAQSTEDLLNSMRPTEALSVALRRAMKPARRGLTAVRDSLRLVESWQTDTGFPFPASE